MKVMNAKRVSKIARGKLGSTTVLTRLEVVMALFKTADKSAKTCHDGARGSKISRERRRAATLSGDGLARGAARRIFGARRQADPRKLLNTESLDYESASEFKSQYHLLSAQGGPTKREKEPDEKLFERLQAFERRQHACVGMLVLLVISVWGAFFAWNTYV
ncbi:unnamed protein product, partial [Prorocentrum cordatum]